jgi:four helix bundle protein
MGVGGIEERMEPIRSYRDLKVWQEAMTLAVTVYTLTRKMPKEEEYRLVAQLIWASASVPANIAEGHARGTRKDYAHFIRIALGSLAETETFLVLAERLGLAPATETAAASDLEAQVGRMLTRLRQRLASPDPPEPSP